MFSTPFRAFSSSRAATGTGRVRRKSVRSVAVIIALAALGAACRPGLNTPNLTTPPAGHVSGATIAARAGLAPGPGILWESDAELNADLDAIKNSGAKWVPIDVDWNSIQGDGPTSFRWDRGLDRAVLAARARGLNIMGMAAYAPPWARGSNCPPGEGHCLPANADDYGRFVTAAAQRYGTNSSNALLRGTITNWQLWNEPNHQEFAMPKPNPDLYAAMVKSSYAGIKYADPAATVITGGTAPAPNAADGTDYTPETWLRGLYARGAGGSFDAVGHHPYAFPTNPLEIHPWNAFTQTLTLHAVMVANGDGNKKIWGTEMGGATGTDNGVLTEAQQAQWVHDYYLGWIQMFGGFTGPLVWMELKDSGTNVGFKWDNLGLLHHDRRPKPAYGAYQQVMTNGIG